MEHQRKVIILAPTLRQAEDFMYVTDGLYFRRPTCCSFDDIPHKLCGIMNTIFFVLPCGEELPHLLGKFKYHNNEFVIVSDWR